MAYLSISQLAMPCVIIGMNLNRKQAILEAKTKHPTFGHNKLAALLGLHRNTVRYHLARAYKDGIAKQYIPLSPVTKQEAVDLFGGKCGKCGYDRCLDALEFHHKGKDKEAGIAKLLNRCAAREVVLKELTRCELLCSICHREHHYAERMRVA